MYDHVRSHLGLYTSESGSYAMFITLDDEQFRAAKEFPFLFSKNRHSEDVAAGNYLAAAGDPETAGKGVVAFAAALAALAAGLTVKRRRK